ncbi:MAG TPA: FAD/NAD(P)-binding protein [Myxococcales bacterium]|nr:FAD/NAD(P)-binding protein [Myxococcales bacterium]
MDVAIVGGGASGTLVAVQLLRQARAPWRIALIERSGALARGVAYGPAEPCHLLNVPAAGMSALPDDEDHFVRWSGAAPEAFVARPLYGAYLEALLADAHRRAAPGISLQLVCGDAIAAAVDGAGPRILLRDGREIRARAAVLALGNLPRRPPFVPDGGLYASTLYRRSPWDRGALDGIPPDSEVALLGTGLTMVDAALALLQRRHRGRIHALSRHGLLPQIHGVPWAPATHRIGALGVRGLLRALRREAARAGDWRKVFDSLRPVTQRLWARLPDAERRRFLRHARAHWDVHRHRMAPEVGAAVARLRASGQLQVISGRVEAFAIDRTGALLSYRPRAERRICQLRAARVVNCTGPASSLAEARHPLVQSLLDQGLALPDSLGIGFSTDPDGALLGGNGLLFTLGALRRGELWESTAIPELRSQARSVATRLVESLSLPCAAEASVGF